MYSHLFSGSQCIIRGVLYTQASPPTEIAEMTASNQAVVGYYAEHCHPQLRGQTVYVQLADQSADFKRDIMPQVI